MKPSIPRAFTFTCAIISLATSTLANQVQFYQKSEDFGVAISSTRDAGNADFLLQLTAPVSYGWASVGTGDKMKESLMFIIYPSGQGDEVVLSVRSAGYIHSHILSEFELTGKNANKPPNSGHDTPNTVSGINATLLSSDTQAGKMTATVQWHQDTGHKYHTVHMVDTKQAWIWAVGPENKGIENAGSVNAGIDQHSHYGVFFADMPASQNDQTTLPSISGTSNLHTKGQPGYYKGLVYVHAILLGVAFVLAFPLGVIGLRWNWRVAFKVHWLLQVVASVAAYIGAAVAIVLSVVGIEFSDFNEGHQVLGFIVVGLLSVQALLGYLHHRQYKNVQRRSVSSYLHVGLGRMVIYAGMVNAILGALLSDDSGIAIAVGAVSAVLAVVMEYITFRGRRQSRGMDAVPSKSSSTIALNNID